MPLRTLALKTRSRTRTILHEFHRRFRDSRKESGSDLPVIVGRRACGCGTGWLVSAIALGVGLFGISGLEAVKVFIWHNGAVGTDLHESVAVGLDRVFVDDTSRVHGGHLVGIQSRDLVPVATVGDAAEFGKEEGNGVVLVGFDFLVPARLGEGGGIAPRVVVEGEEVGAFVVGAAVEVQSLLFDVFGYIGRGVTDGNGTLRARLDVLLHVARDGLDVGRGIGVVLVVDDLVAREEEQEVVVAGEGVDGGEDGLEIDVVVRHVEIGLGGAVERVFGCVCVEGEVDAGLVEHLHGLVVVLGIVDRVDANHVDAEINKVLHVARKALEIEQRVCCIGSTTWDC